MSCCHNEKNDVDEKTIEMGHTITKKKHRHNHGFMMILCLIPMGLLMYFLYSDSNQLKSNSWFYLIIFLCPLMHLFMMRGMHGNKNHENHHINEDEKENYT